MKTAEAAESLKANFKEAILEEVHFLCETTLKVSKERLIEILHDLKKGGFEVLMDLTAVDYLKPTLQTKVVYWLHNPVNFERIRIVVMLGREEFLPSVSSLWEGADWYEREIFDMFGVIFNEHPDLKRILMPEDWIGHPLRRDYGLTEESVEFKHGVKPKIPSEIIPHVKA